MNWLLITTRENPGDSFARYGVENLIREVDKDARFELLDKEDDSHWHKAEKEHFKYDRAIICSMPLFWSHEKQSTSDIWWFEKLFRSGIPKAKLCGIGIGDYIGERGIHDEKKYDAAMEEVAKTTAFVTTRHQLARQHPSFKTSICPSAWCLSESPIAKRTRHLINVMPNGSHEPDLCPTETEAWWKYLKDYGKSDAEFVAHSPDEYTYAKDKGYTTIHFFCSHRKYLQLYSECQTYFGNRLHGGLVAAIAGAIVTVVGCDSRTAMCDAIGLKTRKPSEISMYPVVVHKLDRLKIKFERDRVSLMLKEFMQ